MPPSERDSILIERILEDYETFTKRLEYSSMDEDKFCNDHSFEGEYAYDAVMNPLCRIVEDVAHLSSSVTDASPDFPWDKIVGFRNFIAHGYSQIDRRLVWDIIVGELPSLIAVLESAQQSDDKEPTSQSGNRPGR